MLFWAASRCAWVLYSVVCCFPNSLAEHHHISDGQHHGDLDDEPFPASRFTGLRCRLLASDLARSSPIPKVFNRNSVMPLRDDDHREVLSVIDVTPTVERQEARMPRCL